MNLIPGSVILFKIDLGCIWEVPPPTPRANVSHWHLGENIIKEKSKKIKMKVMGKREINIKRVK
jgi:hypothetical protein